MSRLTVAQGTALSVGAVLGTGVISMPALAASVAGPAPAPAASSCAGGYGASVLGGGERTQFGTFLLIVGSVFAMNWFGLRISGRVQLILTGVLATLLLVTVIAALPHAHLANLHPFAPHGWSAVGAAAAV